MKKIMALLVVVSLCACGNTAKEKNAAAGESEASVEKQRVAVVYASYGEKIIDDGAISSEQMHQKYQTIAVGDSLQVKFRAEVSSVCKKKGCFMRLILDENEKTFVKFKDYGFFVPNNIEGKNVIVQGKAFITETSIEDLKHYAADEGKSAEEIAAITEPERELSFIASGVLIEE